MRQINASQKTAARRAGLTKRMEEILKAVHFYRYVTARDITHLLYSPTSLTHVRELLSALSGNADETPREYLYRFRLPGDQAGNRVYTLGSRGRDFLVDVVGLPAEWYFRPYKVGHMSYSQLTHNLVLTRFLIAASLFSRRQRDFLLTHTRICYELPRGRAAVKRSSGENGVRVPVVPDAWLLFTRVADGKRFPVLLEIDRGSAHQRKFKEHIASRIEYLQSGTYEAVFGISAVIIAYATTGAIPAYRETRREAMCTWTKETLATLEKANWARIFRFQSISFDDLYTTPLFEEACWYRPDSLEPVMLLS